MIITYSKTTITTNIVSFTNENIDAIIANSKLDASIYYITETDMPWVEKTLILADYHVRKTLLHLLNKDITNNDKSTLVYNISISHPLQQSIIPQLIEEALMEYVNEQWLTGKNITPSNNRSNIFTELKSIALISTNKIHKTYHIL